MEGMERGSMRCRFEARWNTQKNEEENRQIGFGSQQGMTTKPRIYLCYNFEEEKKRIGREWNAVNLLLQPQITPSFAQVQNNEKGLTVAAEQPRRPSAWLHTQ